MKYFKLFASLFAKGVQNASLFAKGVQNVHHLHGHMPGDAFFTDQLQCR